MSKKDNFSQAMFEMFGLGKAPEDGEELDEAQSLDSLDLPVAEAADPAPVEAAPAPVVEAPFIEEAPTPIAAEPVAPAPRAAEPAAPASAEDDFFDVFAQKTPVKRANCTYFAEGTSMEGTLRSDSDVEICGDFKGEIASDGKVTIHANTSSSIAAAELVLVDCNLVGDAMVAGDVSINEKSAVAGNIRAANLICSGIIKGNLNVKGNITLTENAQILGDIKTGTLAMSRGAKVSGKVDMGNT